MKRILAWILVVVMSTVFFPALAEEYQTEAFVDVTNCTLRKTPTDDTSASNSMAKLENGYTMLVIGTSGEYHVILPSTVCNRNGESLGLPDTDESGNPLYGYVKEGHITLGKKQYVVLTEYSYLYRDRVEDKKYEIGEKSAGEELILFEVQQNWDGTVWYQVQLQGKTAGIAYLPQRCGYVKEDAIFGEKFRFEGGETPEEPSEQAVEQASKPEDSELDEESDPSFEPDIEEDWSQEEMNPQTPPNVEITDFAYVNCKRLAVYSDSSRTVKLGTLKDGDEVQVIREEGPYSVILFEAQGAQFEGYVLTMYLDGAAG